MIQILRHFYLRFYLENSCWISSSFKPYNIWAFLAPALAITLTNFAFFGVALKKTVNRRNALNGVTSSKGNLGLKIKPNKESERIQKQLQRRINLKILKGSLSLCTLLGLTWIFFLLYIHQEMDVFSYFFILLNASQVCFLRKII